MSFGMSVMNAGATPNSVFNGDSWNNLATQAGVERATEKITGAVDKGSQKIADAVAKIKINNCEQPVPPSPAARVFHDALKSIATSTSQVADKVLGCPNETKAAIESASSIARQLTDLTASASRTAQENEGLQKAAAEATQASDWVGKNLCAGCNR